MATAAILKMWKNAISPQQYDRFWRHLAWWWVWAFQTLSANEISQIWKSKIHFENWKILISLQPIGRFYQNLTCSWVMIFWTPLAKNLVILKMKDGGGGHLENRIIAIYLLWIDLFWKNFWHGDVSHSSQQRQHIKFYAFNNSMCWSIAIRKYKKNMISKTICSYFSSILVC